ncbi:MAG TPA: hypothetical protein VME18_11570 [Acidobacteriaceae bacterium]|nr:hypothetical protein [Acidobacteriaceae bacterium]
MAPFLHVWVGADDAGHALSFALIPVLARFIRVTLLLCVSIGFAAGRQHRMMISPLGEGDVNLVCSIVLAHFMGAVGVATGTLIGACLGVLLRFLCSMPGTDSLRFRRISLLVGGISMSIACFLRSAADVCIALRYTSSLPIRAGIIGAGEIAALVFAAYTIIPAAERADTASRLRQLRRRLSGTTSGPDSAA